MSIMGGWVSDWQVAEWASGLGPCWASLHFTEPIAGSESSSELIGASYARASATMELSGPRAVANANQIDWYGLSAGTITHVGLFTAAVGGHLRCVVPLGDPLVVVAGGKYSVPPGGLVWVW